MLCIAFIALCAGGCSRSAPHSKSPLGTVRIISLAPSLTEIVCAVGGGELLAGRTSACDYPPETVKNVPIIGGFGVPSLEMLVALQPTLVIDVDLSDETLAARISDLGIEYRRIRCGGLADIPQAIREVGMLCGCDSNAEELARKLENSLSELESQACTFTNRPSVYAEIWHDPITTAGHGAFLSDLVRLAGGYNVGDEVAGDYFRISHEQVLALDPDVIVCLYMTGAGNAVEEISRRPGWRRLKAVRNGAVYDKLNNDIILRPGPRVLEGIAALRECVVRR